MAQYRIEAISASTTQTVSNTTSSNALLDRLYSFPSPAEFTSTEAAQAQADAYVEHLNHSDYNHAWDWVGTATLVVV